MICTLSYGYQLYIHYIDHTIKISRYPELINNMYSGLSRCSTARGPGPGPWFALGGLSKVGACKSTLFTESSRVVEISCCLFLAPPRQRSKVCAFAHIIVQLLYYGLDFTMGSIR